MHTAKNQLRFLSDFSQMDLNSFRSGDWLNLHEDIVAFLGLVQVGDAYKLRSQVNESDPPVAVVMPTDLVPGKRLSRATIRAMQEAARDVLKLVVTARQRPDLFRGPRRTIQIRYDLVPLFKSRSLLFVSGRAREVFVFMLHLVLSQQPSDKLKTCPQCDKIFLRVRRQRYCSRQCTNRANMRAFLARSQGRDATRRYARERYARKQRERLGENVRVAPRRSPIEQHLAGSGGSLSGDQPED